MCLCGLEKTQFRNELKSSINAGRYTADYLSCGNLPYPAREMCMTAHLSYRRIRRYLVWRLKRPEARDFSRVRIELLIHSVAFCCISTGEFHFPKERAAQIAVHTVREFLQQETNVKKVIFNVFKDLDREIYEHALAEKWVFWNLTDSGKTS